MKANEVRVGNILNYKDQQLVVYQFQSDPDDYIGGKLPDGKYVWDVIEVMSPVPLTEEWLLKFGFNNKTISDEEDPFQSGNYWENSKFKIEQTTENFHWYYGCITEVHQLQNIYYCATGEELTPKEK